MLPRSGKSIAEMISKHSWILLLIIAYGLFQGLVTVPGCIYRLMTFQLLPFAAANQILLFILGLTITLGSIGLFRMKLWGHKMTQMTYVALLPIVVVAIKDNVNAGVFFLLMRSMDILIALSILFYLTQKDVISKFK